jgi:hypothetical protein
MTDEETKWSEYCGLEEGSVLVLKKREGVKAEG